LRAVERAYAQVDDADPDPTRIVLGRVDRRGQIVQRGEIEPTHAAASLKTFEKIMRCRVGLLP
jgi:hypothetical protein